MTTIKFKNIEIINMMKMNEKLENKLREVTEEYTNYYGSKKFKNTLNNIILEEVIKTTKKLSRKYNFDCKEALSFVLRTKITEDTPDSLKQGNVDEEFSEEYETFKASKVDVYKQVISNEVKYWIKNENIYDENLKEVGKMIGDKICLN